MRKLIFLALFAIGCGTTAMAQQHYYRAFIPNGWTTMDGGLHAQDSMGVMSPKDLDEINSIDVVATKSDSVGFYKRIWVEVPQSESKGFRIVKDGFAGETFIAWVKPLTNVTIVKKEK